MFDGARARAERGQPRGRDAPAGGASRGSTPTLAPWLPLLGILLGLDLPPTPETARLDERFLRETLADVDDALPRVEPRGHAGDARRRGRALHGRGERRPAAAACRWRAPTCGRSSSSRTPTPGTTWAPTDDEDLRCLSFTLCPLREEDAAEIVRARHRRRARCRPTMSTRSRGDPAATRCSSSSCSTWSARPGRRRRCRTPSSRSIAGDIDRLSPSDRTVLRYASVLGASFDTALLATAVHDDVELDAGVWERLRGLVDGDPLGRDAVQEHARPGRRVRGPAVPAPPRAARARRRGDRGALGLVRRGGGLGARAALLRGEARRQGLAATAGSPATAPERSSRTSRRRGSTSARSRRHAAAATCLPASGRRCGSRSAPCRTRRADSPRPTTRFASATKLLSDDPAAQAETYENRTRARIRSGEYGRALRETTVGLRVVAGQDAPGAAGARSRLQAQRAELRLLQGHPREAIALALEAAAEGERIGELEAVARAYTALDGAYQMLGQPEKATHERKAVDIWEQLGRLRSVGIVELNLGVQAYADGHWDEAVAGTSARGPTAPPPATVRTSPSRPPTWARCSSVGASSTTPRRSSPMLAGRCARRD